MQNFFRRTADPTQTSGLRTGLAPRAPAAPVPPPDAPPFLPCANCGTALTGPYCGQCGQHVADYHRSVWRFVTDFLDNTFCWDNKLLRTVEPLVRQPGFLTQEFMAGRRVRYVHPLRLFLFSSAICLALIGFINHHAEGSGRAGKKRRSHVHIAPASAPVHSQTEIKTDGGDDEDTPARAAPAAEAVPFENPAPTVSASAETPAPSGPSFAAKIQQVLAAGAARNTGPSTAAPILPAVPTPAPSAIAAPTPPAAPPENASTSSLGEKIRQALRESGKIPARPGASPTGSTGAAKSADADGDALEARLNRIAEKAEAAVEKATADQERAQKIGKIVTLGSGSEQVGQVAEAISQGIEQRLSWVGLALLPVFAFLLHALYRRRGGYYFAHLVFSLHYHSFLFMFWAAWTCADLVLAAAPLAGFWSFLLGCSLLLPGWYLYVALRRLYDDSRRRTVAKVMVLGAMHIVIIMIGVVSAGAAAYFSTQK